MKPWYKKWWGIILGVALFGVLIMFFLFSLLILKAVNENKDTGGGFTQATNLPAASQASGNLRLATADDPSIGPLNAKVTVVEFADFQCPYCGQAFTIIREIESQYQNRVRFIYRYFPLQAIHPDALNSSLAGQCANEQGKFWPYHDKLYRNQQKLDIASLKKYAKQVGLDEARFNTCLDSSRYAQKIAEDFDDGVAAGVRGTPTWFVDGHKIEGVVSADAFKQVLDLELAR